MGVNNPLSWSVSRSEILQHCRKKYFFVYYTNFLKLWDTSLWLSTLLLKNLKSLDMWIGEIIHKGIGDYLRLIYEKNDTQDNINKLKYSLTEEMDNSFLFSKQKDYKRYDKNNRFGLSEHYYGINIDDKFEFSKEKVINDLNNFINSNFAVEIKKEILSPGRIFIEPREPSFENMKVSVWDDESLENIILRAQPDFGIIKENGTDYLIYDWKSGREDDKERDSVSNQLKNYAYKLLLNTGGPQKLEEINIECYELYVSSMNIYGRKIVKEDIDSIKRRIRKDMEIQRGLIQGGDVNRNIPLSIQFFPRTEDKNKCERCRFQEVCYQIKDYEEQNFFGT